MGPWYDAASVPGLAAFAGGGSWAARHNVPWHKPAECLRGPAAPGVGFDTHTAHSGTLSVQSMVVGLVNPNGTFCFCGVLKCLLPSCWGVRVWGKPLGRSLWLCFHNVSFYYQVVFHPAWCHSFFCLNILIFFFGGSVLLSILFFIYVNIYKYIFLISKAFFSVDVEGWWYIFMKEKSSQPLLRLTKAWLFHTASWLELCGACLTRLEQTASLGLRSLGLACLTISPIVILTRLSLGDGFFWPFSDKDNFLNFHFIWQQVVWERKEVLQWFMD